MELSSASNTAVVIIFQTFVNGDVVYAETWEVLTLKNPIEPPYIDFVTCCPSEKPRIVNFVCFPSVGHVIISYGTASFTFRLIPVHLFA